MFEKPEYVFKDGRQIVKNGRVVESVVGATHVVRPEFERGIETDLDTYFDRYMTVHKDSLVVSDDEIRDFGRAELNVHPTTPVDT